MSYVLTEIWSQGINEMCYERELTLFDKTNMCFQEDASVGAEVQSLIIPYKTQQLKKKWIKVTISIKVKLHFASFPVKWCEVNKLDSTRSIIVLAYVHI